MYGVKRGLYSNEAGMGSAPNAAATASVSHPAKQGLVQMLSVFIDTLLICTCSAMMVLVFYVQDPQAASALNGMPLVQMAVNNSVGESGIHFITFAIFAFAFSSLIGNYFYAENNLALSRATARRCCSCSAWCACAWCSTRREQLRLGVEPRGHLHGLHGAREPHRPALPWKMGACGARRLHAPA